MRRKEAYEIWERENSGKMGNWLGEKCLNEKCSGKYQRLTKPYKPIDFPRSIAYLECNICEGHLCHSTFKEWFLSKKSHAKARVKDFERILQNLQKDLERIKKKVAEAKIALKVAKQERKRWGY